MFITCVTLISEVGSVRHIFVCRKTRRGAVFYCRRNLPLAIRGIEGRDHFRPHYKADFVFIVVVLDVLLSSTLILVFPKLRGIGHTI